MATNKGFIKDLNGNFLLPITRGELILDSNGQVAFHSNEFLAGNGLPGLMTAAEKAMLSGSGSGQSLSDIYNKLGYINTGLKYGDAVLHFYNENGGTPIEISQEAGLSISTAGNKISFGLEKLSQTPYTILNQFTVDEYGRISSIIDPNKISGTLLENCITTSEPSTENSIVNKAYVDSMFGTVSTGALKFKGSIADADAAETQETQANEGCYYKATGNFIYSIDGKDTSIKTGDTLIVYQGKFVHVPSGDDITALTIQQEGSTVTNGNNLLGNITINTNNPLQASVTGKLINLSILQANDKQSGYITKDDYNLFKSYSQSLKVEYTPTITSGYTIGTLKIGDSTETIYGIDTNLSLSENSTSLVFTKAGVADTTIPITGVNGVSVVNDNGTLKFQGNYIVGENSTKYLSITGNTLDVKLASVNEGKLIDGLVDSTQFRTILSIFSYFEAIVNDLTNTSLDTTKDYFYGSDALKAAINF